MFRGSVKGTGYPLHSPVFPSLPLPCITVCHHISTGVYEFPRWQGESDPYSCRHLSHHTYYFKHIKAPYPCHSLKEQAWGGGLAFITSVLKWVVSFMLRPRYIPVKSTRYPLNTRQGANIYYSGSRHYKCTTYARFLLQGIGLTCPVISCLPDRTRLCANGVGRALFLPVMNSPYVRNSRIELCNSLDQGHRVIVFNCMVCLE